MSSNFPPPGGMALPGNLATRRGSQNIKPLSFDTIKQNSSNEGSIPTPRTSRSHLLAGLRTAPKSANAASYNGGPASPTSTMSAQQYVRGSMTANLHGYPQDNVLRHGAQTAYPQYAVQQQNGYQGVMGHQQQYTVDQVLAPPEIAMDEQSQEHMDPNLYAQLVATNMYLAQQQQRLQQQLRSVQAAAQQFQQLNLNNPQLAQQQMAIFEQQQQLRNLQQQLGVQAAMGQGQQVYYSPVTGQYYVDTPAATPMSSRYAEQPMSPGFNGFQQLQQPQQQQRAPRVQVSPPPENRQSTPGHRNISPPRRYDSPVDVTPLPPPSANAFRRSHKKTSSTAAGNASLSSPADFGLDGLRSAGPKTASFPLTPLTGGYGPGQARAGEHPIRQPRGPPSLDELKSKPTAKDEGSKNFATRTRRSAVHNLVRAGLERRKGAGSLTGSMSPTSEMADDLATPITDNESDSGRSGSGILAGELEYGASRTPVRRSWGAIGSDRPSSRQNARTSVESLTSAGSASATNDSFAAVFKNGALRASKPQGGADKERKSSRLVLTSVEKRKASPPA